MRKAFFRTLAVLCPIKPLRDKLRQLAKNPADNMANIMLASVDIAKVPHARGYMGVLQRANLKMLVAFDRLCHDNGIEYFLIGGAIIGKIRHNGFIPWDDDIDVGMMSKDWYKLVDVLKKKFPNPEFDLSYGDHWNIIKIIHRKSGVFIDIFRFERFSRDIDYVHDYGTLWNAKKKFSRKFWRSLIVKHRNSIYITANDDKKSAEEKWAKIFDSVKKHESEFNKMVLFGGTPSDNGGVIHFAGNSKHHEFFPKNIIFPLQRIEFEGAKLPFPNQIEDYAFLVWGNIWTFPDNVFTQHGTIKYNRNRYIEMRKVIDMTDAEFYKLMTGGKK
ncbi:MAG: LicD family protein [Alphaproteobacteria bacterium]|nr:LicD family protein [Alphaproteobacteria bacterium]